MCACESDVKFLLIAVLVLLADLDELLDQLLLLALELGVL
jgi:hypothetical protein